MISYGLYFASVLGAVALYLMMPRRGYSPTRIGALLGALTLGGLWLWLARRMPELTDPEQMILIYQYLFGAIAVAGAVRVITNTRPVYAALWFVMVILSSAGMLLLLDAEFIAIALVIIYAGAILVTYVFVIMLASQSDHETGPGGVALYDRVAREPAAAVAVGFVMMALLLSVAFGDLRPNPRAADPDDTVIRALLTGRSVDRLLERIEPARQDGIADVAAISNIERVGLDLFEKHPLGIELAGVILLVALVGAVVIARQRVELEEQDEARTVARTRGQPESMEDLPQ